jgi:aldose sugar dehydrogenase
MPLPRLRGPFLLITMMICTSAQAAQTDAPAAPATLVEVEEIAKGLNEPWGLDFLPDGRMLVTERDGLMRIIAPDGAAGAPIQGLPEVAARGQGGLLDIRIAPDFATSGHVFLSYAEPRDGGKSATAAMRARLTITGDSGTLSEAEVIFRQEPAIASTRHFGSRLIFDKTGALFITTGDRGSELDAAQDLASQIGKVIRITTDGKPAGGNPFLGQDGKDPAIWSYGHRNIQGAALHPETGELWTTEHGPRGGDELNLTRAGKNYGWPVITYGIDYSGRKISDLTEKDGMEQPVYYWVPSIATSGLDFYTGDLFQGWKGNLLAGGLAGAMLERLVLDGDKVVASEKLLTERGDRVRAVRTGPDGAVWILTGDRNGLLLRLTPAG